MNSIRLRLTLGPACSATGPHPPRAPERTPARPAGREAGSGQAERRRLDPGRSKPLWLLRRSDTTTEAVSIKLAKKKNYHSIRSFHLAPTSHHPTRPASAVWPSREPSQCRLFSPPQSSFRAPPSRSSTLSSEGLSVLLKHRLSWIGGGWTSGGAVGTRAGWRAGGVPRAGRHALPPTRLPSGRVFVGRVNAACF